MKISPLIDVVAAELEARAFEDGWKVVGMAIADHYHANGGGDILPAIDAGDGLRNAVQRVKRIIRGCDGPRYSSLAVELIPVALSVLPAERRVRMVSPRDPALLAAVTAKESIRAINAVHLRAAPAVALKAINHVISAFRAMKSVIEPLCRAAAGEVCRGNYA
ncbi:toxin YdaT family protein [Erwinia amylovora]|uniref:toxin YdaT family protein n=1 Tax=Erwinia amylovora TaxID=552 RepID=UPI001443D1A9|nr:toxin YdaT family protein [Erwinia amylovora]